MCDCAVALSPVTARSSVIFGKNSDRERDEAQPIRQLPAAEHTAGARVRTTYIEIPQVRQTAAVLGSGPFWIWGLEQGVNEHGVAIGNESVFTHEELELPAEGLLGMDLVRLGLERSRSAHQAVAVITELIERHGQGGNGFQHGRLSYSNGFLIADRREAWSLQTSSRHWASKRISELETLSNHPSIGSDWEALSADAESFACERGWWDSGRGRFDFEAAYRSTRLLPADFSDGRRGRSRSLLNERAGEIDERDFFRLLRDHGGRSPIPPGEDKTDASYYTLCAHNDVQQHSTASMVAPLDRSITWFALATPCTSVYLPLSVVGRVPAPLLVGGAEPTDASAWWQFKQLQLLTEADYAKRQPCVREAFAPLEEEWLSEAARPCDAAQATARMEEACARALETVRKLHDRFAPSA